MVTHWGFARSKKAAGSASLATARQAPPEQQIEQQRPARPKLRLKMSESLHRKPTYLGNSASAQCFLAHMDSKEAHRRRRARMAFYLRPARKEHSQKQRREARRRYMIELLEHSGDDGWQDYFHWRTRHPNRVNFSSDESCDCSNYGEPSAEVPDSCLSNDMEELDEQWKLDSQPTKSRWSSSSSTGWSCVAEKAESETSLRTPQIADSGVVDDADALLGHDDDQGPRGSFIFNTFLLWAAVVYAMFEAVARLLG